MSRIACHALICVIESRSMECIVVHSEIWMWNEVKLEVGRNSSALCISSFSPCFLA
jgi:hypothetical protein